MNNFLFECLATTVYSIGPLNDCLQKKSVNSYLYLEAGIEPKSERGLTPLPDRLSYIIYQRQQPSFVHIPLFSAAGRATSH